MTIYNIIVAICQNNGIGFENKIPWYHKDDLKFFQKITKGNLNNAIIMGKNTYLSLNKPLKNRYNIVISTTLKIENELVKTFSNIDEAINFCNNSNFSEVWICGGENIYNQFLTNYKYLIDSIYVNELDIKCKCDKFFNVLDIISKDDFFLFNKEQITYDDGLIIFNQFKHCNKDYQK